MECFGGFTCHACVSNGTTCSEDSDCCSGTCTNNTCGACVALGANGCGNPGECCGEADNELEECEVPDGGAAGTCCTLWTTCAKDSDCCGPGQVCQGGSCLGVTGGPCGALVYLQGEVAPCADGYTCYLPPGGIGIGQCYVATGGDCTATSQCSTSADPSSANGELEQSCVGGKCCIDIPMCSGECGLPSCSTDSDCCPVGGQATVCQVPATNSTTPTCCLPNGAISTDVSQCCSQTENEDASGNVICVAAEWTCSGTSLETDTQCVCGCGILSVGCNGEGYIDPYDPNPSSNCFLCGQTDGSIQQCGD